LFNKYFSLDKNKEENNKDSIANKVVINEVAVDKIKKIINNEISSYKIEYNLLNQKQESIEKNFSIIKHNLNEFKEIIMEFEKSNIVELFKIVTKHEKIIDEHNNKIMNETFKLNCEKNNNNNNYYNEEINKIKTCLSKLDYKNIHLEHEIDKQKTFCISRDDHSISIEQLEILFRDNYVYSDTESDE